MIEAKKDLESLKEKVIYIYIYTYINIYKV